MRSRRFSVGESSTPGNNSAVKLRRTLSVGDFRSQRSSSSLHSEVSSRVELAANTGWSHYRRSMNGLLQSPLTHGVDQSTSLFQSWLLEPIFISNEELAKILRIRKIFITRVPLGNVFVCYFRAYEISVDQFWTVLKHLKGEGVDMQLFEDALKYGHKMTTVTVRYVGQTGEGQNPWTRSSRTLRNGSLHKRFLDSFKKHYPGTPIKTEIFEIIDSRIEIFPPAKKGTLSYLASRHLINQMERVLIRFFRPSTLLNVQLGGILSDHGLDSSCEQILAGCKTSLLTNLDIIQPLDLDTTRSITNLFENWWDFSRQYLWKKYKRVPTETFVKNTIPQALPNQFVGTTLAVICGEETPIETLNDGATFFSGRRASASAVKDLLESIGQSELGTQHLPIQNLYSLIGLNQLHILPRLVPEDRERSRALLDSWLGLLRPLFVFPLGRCSAAWLRPSKRLSHFPIISHETGVARAVDLPLNSPLSIIVIPMMHPGYTMNSGSPALYRIHWFSWLSAWVHLNTAINILRKGTSCDFTRQDLVQKILVDTRDVLKASGFYKEFTKVKKTMAAEIKMNKDDPGLDTERIPVVVLGSKQKSGKWSDQECTTLESLVEQGKMDQEIAVLLGRTRQSVTAKRQRSQKTNKTAAQTSSGTPGLSQRLKQASSDDCQQQSNSTTVTKTAMWKRAEIQSLQNLIAAGKSIEEITRLLRRTQRGVKRMLFKLQKESTEAQSADCLEEELAHEDVPSIVSDDDDEDEDESATGPSRVSPRPKHASRESISTRDKKRPRKKQ